MKTASPFTRDSNGVLHADRPMFGNFPLPIISGPWEWPVVGEFGPLVGVYECAWRIVREYSEEWAEIGSDSKLTAEGRTGALLKFVPDLIQNLKAREEFLVLSESGLATSVLTIDQEAEPASQASADRHAAIVRWAVGLPAGDRRLVLVTAIDAADRETLAALLTAPACYALLAAADIELAREALDPEAVAKSKELREATRMAREAFDGCLNELSKSVGTTSG